MRYCHYGNAFMFCVICISIFLVSLRKRRITFAQHDPKIVVLLVLVFFSLESDDKSPLHAYTHWHIPLKLWPSTWNNFFFVCLFIYLFHSSRTCIAPAFRRHIHVHTHARLHIIPSVRYLTHSIQMETLQSIFNVE